MVLATWESSRSSKPLHNIYMSNLGTILILLSLHFIFKQLFSTHTKKKSYSCYTSWYKPVPVEALAEKQVLAYTLINRPGVARAILVLQTP